MLKVVFQLMARQKKTHSQFSVTNTISPPKAFPTSCDNHSQTNDIVVIITLSAHIPICSAGE